MAKSTLLIFGDSGTFKTSNLGLAAKYIYRKTRGKQVRLVTAEQFRPILHLVTAGLIDVCSVTRSNNPLVTLRKLSYGWWMDETGQKLVPPKGKLEDTVGGYLIEGTTSISDILMEDARDKQRQLGQQPVGKFMEEDEKFCNNPLDHYGFVQREMLARIRSFAALTVDYVIFTGHEAKGEEEVSRSPIRGPGLTGTAATDKVGKEVGSLIHFESYSEATEVADPKTKVRSTIVRNSVKGFFVPHPDPKVPGVIYKCKTRVPMERFEDLMKIFPGGYFEPTLTSGLDRYLEVEDSLTESSVGGVGEWMEAQQKGWQATPEAEPVLEPERMEDVV